MPEKKEKTCFVIMPFKDELKDVYWQAIRPACELAGFKSLRVDELKGAFNINRKIIEHIFTSEAIVADLTGWNPNVFYEMGVAHAIANKTLMIIQKQDRLPFDISNYHCIIYQQTPSGLNLLQAQIHDNLRFIEQWRLEPTNPVQDFKPFNAFVLPGELLRLQRELNDANAKVKSSVALEEYDKVQKDFARIRQALTERPDAAQVQSLEQEIDGLKALIAKKDQQIQSLQVQATPKPEPKSRIVTPPGMVLIPAGEFIMGTSDAQIEKYLKENKDFKRESFEDEQPEHSVWLDDFFIDIYPVTNAQFAEFLNDWGQEKDEDGNEMIEAHEWGVHKVKNRWQPQPGVEKHPVIQVTWFGANQYARWADKQLPTEAQWEKAARGGQGFEYATRTGKISPELANYDDSNIGKTTPVGQYPANPYGLYDMSGNVWEWCQDWYNETYYRKSPKQNPTGPDQGDRRVLRGGSWDYQTIYTRCAYRFRYVPLNRYRYIGFRCSRAYL